MRAGAFEAGRSAIHRGGDPPGLPQAMPQRRGVPVDGCLGVAAPVVVVCVSSCRGVC